MDHIKICHKDKYISILEIKQKVCEKPVHKLVKSIEKIIENKELKSVKHLHNKIIKRKTGDEYDQEDKIELDSERE